MTAEIRGTDRRSNLPAVHHIPVPAQYSRTCIVCQMARLFRKGTATLVQVVNKKGEDVPFGTLHW